MPTKLCLAVLVIVTAVSIAALDGPGAAASAARCPVVPDPAALPSAAKLKSMNAFVARLGARPTGSVAQNRYIDWIRRQLTQIPGVRLSELRFPIDRWSTTSARLSIRIGHRSLSLPIADAVPYSAPTGAAGVTAPVAVVAPGEPITAANARGRIVIRQADAGSVPLSVFKLPLISWNTYDPGQTIDPAGTFSGDFIAYSDRVHDLQNAGSAGAKGIVFVKNLPRSQLIGHYEPYEGLRWKVPGVFVGADQGQLITDAIAAGQPITADIVVRAHFRHVITPSILATINGASRQRILIDSHTDGTNAVEDNGPVAMIAMARYFASTRPSCRPRTIEFAFSTAHFYQRVANQATRDGGAEQLAQQLDRDYSHGTVSSVLTIEHLGARDYEQVARPHGYPGEQLKPDGLRAIQFIGVTPSAALVHTVNEVVHRYKLSRTVLLHGNGTPTATVPAYCSFGGEGTPYERHLLPTIGIISAPQYLYNPAFGLGTIDFNVMHSELLAYTALVQKLGIMRQAAVAGQVTRERKQRSGGAAGCPPEL